MTKKNGLKRGVQQYKCYYCGKQFSGGERLDNALLWDDYLRGKQTYQQLATKYKCSEKTIRRRLDEHSIIIPKKQSRRVIVLMDTTYWGRNFGVMLFKDAISGQNLLKYFVKNESNTKYKEGINALKNLGYEIVGIVCDGRRWLLQSFEGVPVQMCQFHQASIIRRYLTKKPKLQASIELMQVVNLMKHTDKESFSGALNDWNEKWKKFLDERSIDCKTKKTNFSHQKLRSAYRSLKNNLPFLFTWYDNIELQIPNTTNAIDGHFADLKNKFRNHNGLSIKRKEKFIEGFLKA